MFDELIYLLKFKEIWDVVTALRGPDNDDENLKTMTTAVLRWFLMEDQREDFYLVGDTYHYKSFEVCSPDNARSIWRGLLVDEKNRIKISNTPHFRGHIIKAFRCIINFKPEVMQYLDFLREEGLV